MGPMVTLFKKFWGASMVFSMLAVPWIQFFIEILRSIVAILVFKPTFLRRLGQFSSSLPHLILLSITIKMVSAFHDQRTTTVLTKSFFLWEGGAASSCFNLLALYIRHTPTIPKVLLINSPSRLGGPHAKGPSCPTSPQPNFKVTLSECLFSNFPR